MLRSNNIKKIKNQKKPWDILIIGGGASGLGAAVDAAVGGGTVLRVWNSAEWSTCV